MKEIKIISRSKDRIIVSSASDARRRYVVVLGSNINRDKCACKRWIFGVKQPDGSRRRQPCKHIRRVRGVA